MMGSRDKANARGAGLLMSIVLLSVSCTGDSAVDPTPNTSSSTSLLGSAPTTMEPVTTTLPPTTTTSTLPVPEPCQFAESAAPNDDSEAGNLLEAIGTRGTVRVGVLPDDVPPFFFCNQGEQSGFEASLARLLVDDALGGVEIQWVPLDTSNRISAVQEGGVDFAIRFTTITPEREGQVAFTTPYLLDGPAVVVSGDAAVDDAAGLDGLRIALVEGTDQGADVTEALENAGLAVELVEAEGPDELIELVARGDADGYGTSWTRGIRDARDTSYTVVPLSFNSAMAVYTSLDESGLTAVLDASLLSLIDSGVWGSEFVLAFGVSPPWSTEDMAEAR